MAVTLSDNFDDNSIDSGKWGSYSSHGGTSVQEVDGQLKLTVPINSAGSYAALYAQNTYNLQGSFAEANFIQAASSGCDNSMFIKDTTSPDGSDFGWICGPSSCYAVVREDWGWVLEQYVGVSLGSSLYLRVREQSGTLYWEYSTNNRSSWTTAMSALVSSLPTPAVTDVDIVFDLYQYSSGATTNATFIVDNFNTPLQVSVDDSINTSESVTGPLLEGDVALNEDDTIGISESISLLPTILPLALSDDFNDNSLDGAKWATSSNIATASEANTQIEIEVPSTTAGAYAEVYTQSNYSFIDRSVFINMSQCAGPSVDSYLFVRKAGSSDYLGFLYSGTLLNSFSYIDSVEDYREAVTLTPNSGLWLRLKTNAGTFYWEYSTDNQQSWTAFDSLPITSLIDLASSTILFGANKWGATESTVTKTIFDNFNTSGEIFSFDDITIDESVSVTGDIFVNVYDSVNLAENIFGSGLIYISLEETVHIIEDFTVYLFQGNISLSIFDEIGIEAIASPSIESTLLVDLGQTLSTVYVFGD